MSQNLKHWLQVEKPSSKLFLITLIFTCLLVSPLQAETESPVINIVVTEVKVEPVSGKKNVKSEAEVVLNGALKIREIRVLEIAGETKLKFPAYISRQGKVYPQVVVHTKEANETILEAIKNGKISSEVIPLEFEITKNLPYEGKGNLESFASVTFNQAVTVECKIMSGKKGLWVSWPARPAQVAGEGWTKQVVILDRELKKKIEKELFRVYQEKKE